MGRPVHADVTSLRATSRSGLADDTFFDLQDGVAVPVGPANTGRLRYNDAVPQFEASYQGAPFVPLGGGGAGWERYLYIEVGATYAEIQAALNDAAYDAVFLQAGNYAITGNLVIPDGKILSGAVAETNPSLGTGVTLTLSSGFQIQVQRGTVQFCRVVIDVASAVNHVTCNGGRVLFVHLTAATAANTMAGFYGIFSELGFCSTNNLRGVTTLGSLPNYMGKWMFIHSCHFHRGNALGNVVHVNDAYVKMQDIYTNGGNYGYRLSGGAIRYHFHFENLVADGVVGTGGILCSTYYRATFNSLITLCNLQGINIIGCDSCTFSGLTSFGCTGDGITISSSYRCQFINCQVYSVSGLRGFSIQLNIGNQYTNLFVWSLNNANGFGFHITDSQSTYTNLSAMTCRGAATYGFYIDVDYCTFTNLVADNAQSIGFYATGCVQSIFTNIIVRECNGAAVPQATFINSTYLQVSNVHVHNSPQVGIQIANCDYSKFNEIQSRLSGGNGIHILQCDFSSFSGLWARESSVNGINLGTVATPGSLNTRCQFNGLHSESNTNVGLAAYYLSECQVANVKTSNNGNNGVLATNNTNTQFSTIHSNNNTAHGIEAGTGDSYCSWSDVHIQNSGAGRTNFLANAATAMCYCNGGFEQLGGATANDNFPVANWTSANLLAIP